MEERKHIIYAFVDDQGQYFYIGKTCNIKRRNREHLFEVKEGNTLPKYNKLRKLIKEGNDFNDLIMVVESNLSCDQVDDKEIYYIRKLREEGYNLKNLTDGGDGGIMTTPGISEKIRKAHLGRKCSEDTKKKMSEARIGMKFTDEHKKKLSIARKKRKTTQKTKDKCSKTSKGKINIKKFKMTDPEGNVYITESGLTVFCEENNLTTANIIKVANGERKHHKGWIAKRLE
jgi:group I intron endonuclease